jgi:LmbE family N-acetylglucosaminyl deacetylase
MNPYQQLAANYARLAREGRSYPLGGFEPRPRPNLPSNAPTVLICSPHPDDEVIVGGLALRLMRESGWRVVNVAVTQGSNRARQAERLTELRGACEWIGFELRQTAPNGLERIHLKAREHEPEHWAKAVQTMAEIFAEERPRVVLFPHATDWNSSHIGTHFLVMDAFRTLPAHFTCYAAETEFWGAMTSPPAKGTPLRLG